MSCKPADNHIPCCLWHMPCHWKTSYDWICCKWICHHWSLSDRHSRNYSRVRSNQMLMILMVSSLQGCWLVAVAFGFDATHAISGLPSIIIWPAVNYHRSRPHYFPSSTLSMTVSLLFVSCVLNVAHYHFCFNTHRHFCFNVTQGFLFWLKSTEMTKDSSFYLHLVLRLCRQYICIDNLALMSLQKMSYEWIWFRSLETLTISAALLWYC